MSYTKGELAMSALEELGMADYEFDITPEQRQSAIGRLDMMIAGWQARGILLSYPISKEENSSPDEDSNIPDWSWEAVVTNLAIRIAPSYGKTVSMETRAIAKNAYTTVCGITSQPREKQFQVMPKGSGYKSAGDPFISAPTDPYLTPIDESIDLTGEPENEL